MDHPSYIEAAAATLGLDIPATAQAGVERYFELAATMAALVEGVTLSPADESVTVFAPVAPRGAEG